MQACGLNSDVKLTIRILVFLPQSTTLQFNLTFIGQCILICSYNKNQRDVQISQIIFGIELYMFRTGFLSIIRSLVLYTHQ
jgi:hypothetical protein